MLNSSYFGEQRREKDEYGSSEEEKLVTILPSYRMHQSTVSKALTPTQENFRIDPPSYDISPMDSRGSDAYLSISALHSPTSEEEPGWPPPQEPLAYDEESASIWENTIIANVHKMDNLTRNNYRVSQDLEVDIKVTRKVCEKGVEPLVYDPLDHEFTQGKYIHGFVTIRNKSSTPIPFDMVYVAFEGVTVTLLNHNGVIVLDKPGADFKFLTMIDLFASWSYSNIARLSTDDGDPHDWCEGETDPYDNTILSIDVKRFFQPNITYKRFFTFKIPDKLLDDICDIHNIPSHSEIPPTLGFPRSFFPPSEVLANKYAIPKDFSMLDSSISYCVNARVIGKASDYKYDTGGHDKYVIAKDASVYIRVIPNYRSFMGHPMWSSVFYDNLVRCVSEKLELGRGLLNTPTEERSEIALTPISSRNSEMKLRQLYSSIEGAFNSFDKKVKDDSFKTFKPYMKKFLGTRKTSGVISLATPKQEYLIPYSSSKSQLKDSNIFIPIDFSYSFDKEKSQKDFPIVKDISADLMVLTIASKKYPIPIEFTHDMCFRDNEVEDGKHRPSNFDSIIINPFKEYVNELSDLIRKVGNNILKVETKFFQDLKCLASLSTKTIRLGVQDVQIYMATENGMGVQQTADAIPWREVNETHSQHKVFMKNFNLKLDLSTANLRSPDTPGRPGNFTISPSFQSCMISRIYFIKVNFKISNGDKISIRVPLFIEKNA
ncbi:uncharacterized protein PRCAT00003769001 [Priceomyces carsonii]|uniref:uncharacterized protein n=1 Tax=Priceomyces carsonii TaxID=28549 RepID=UPI002ED9FB37|nr:unnamed protein product [Priceomyces carsonii]